MSDNDYISSISLRIKDPVRELGEILEDWGLEVGRSWTAGAARTTPRGEPLNGRYSHSYAYARLPLAEARTLVDCLERALETIAPFSNELISFVNSGGSAELFVAWHFEGSSGDLLDWQLLRRLADHKIGLSLDIYPEVEPERKDMRNASS